MFASRATSCLLFAAICLLIFILFSTEIRCASSSSIDHAVVVVLVVHTVTHMQVAIMKWRAERNRVLFGATTVVVSDTKRTTATNKCVVIAVVDSVTKRTSATRTRTTTIRAVR